MARRRSRGRGRGRGRAGSGTQQVNFMEKFCVKAGISCRFILY